MIHIKKNSDYSRLTEYLESMIAAGVYQTGDRLPPLRELSQRFDINLDTARRGIWHLRDKGMLECRRGCGVFINGHADRPEQGLRIGVLLYTADLTKTYCAHVLLGMQQAALDFGVILETRAGFALGKTFDQAAIKANSAGCDALVILGTYDFSQTQFLAQCPAVGVEMHRMYGGAISVVSLDPVEAAEQSAQYFRKRDCRQVAVFTNPAPLHSFRAQLAQLQLTANGIDATIHTVDEIPEATQLPPPAGGAGLLFTGGELFEHTSRRYREKTARTLTADFATLAIDGKSLILPGYEPVDTIAADWPAIGRVALGEALRRIRSPGTPAKRIYLTPRLVTSASGDALQPAATPSPQKHPSA